MREMQTKYAYSVMIVAVFVDESKITWRVCKTKCYTVFVSQQFVRAVYNVM